jgi:MHS family alpha-ketoglutarate permease-like MFS transporter
MKATMTNEATKINNRVLSRMSREQKKKIVAGSLGNAVEYIDWAIYASLAPIFAPKFFPANDDVAALLGTLAIFAVGFIMRPVGGAVLGSFADKHGRKTGLALSILIMSMGGLTIALSPTYEQAGVLAPIILLVARLAQGFAAGGEYGTSSAYLVEAASNGRRAFAGSFQQVSITAGILAASGLSYLLTANLDEGALSSWGWRLGFAIAAVLGLIVLWYRTRVGDSEAFEAMKESSEIPASPMKTLFRDHWKSILWVAMITAPISVLHYIWVVYMPAFASSSYDLPLSQTLLAQTISTTVLMFVLPLFGMLSDRFGRKPTLILSCAGSLVLSYPAFQFAGNGFWSLLFFQLLAVVFLAPYLANLAVVMAEQLPAKVRTTGIGFPYAVAVAIFGGTAPYAITAMSEGGLLHLVWIYPAVMAAIGVLGFSLIRETSRDQLS